MRGTDGAPGSIRGDPRGVSPVIGALLVLAIVMLALSILQTTAIPALNAQHEFQHNERVQTDMAELAAAADRVAATGVGEPVSLAVGMRYPPRLLFINPPPVAGSLRATPPATVTIRNATATGETGDYWNGDPRRLATRSVRYAPDYNAYDGAPVTVVEPWAVYDRFDGSTLTAGDTDLIDGRRISLVTIAGRYNRSSAGSISPVIRPRSTPVRTVAVSSGADPLELTIPTRATNETWSTLLADELARAGGSVAGYSCESEPPQPCGELTLTFTPGTYTLALGAVSVGGGTDRPGAAYLTDVEGGHATVPAAGRQRLVVEARDRFDNPVPGVTVDASLGGDPGELRAVAPETGVDGRAVFTYEAPASVDRGQNVTVRAAFGNGSAAASVTFDLRVLDTGGAAAPTDSAARVEGVDGSVTNRRVAGGRAVQFDIRAAEPVAVTGVAVDTRNDLAGVTYDDQGATVGGSDLPATVIGVATVDLRTFDRNGNLRVRRFVDPDGGQADVVVTLTFADGSVRRFGLG